MAVLALLGLSFLPRSLYTSGMFKPLLLIAFTMALLGCGQSASSDSPRTAKKQRIEAAEAALGRSPDVRTYHLDGSELKSIEVPVKDSSGFVDSQRCFVWRDQEFKTATISCGQQPDILLSN